MNDISDHPSVQLQIVYLPLDQIRPDPTNPRLHGKRHVRQLAKSIEAFGFNAPILIDNEGQIVAGHGRHAAAVVLELLTVPTICVGHLSPQQRRAYMVADNRLGDLSNWDGNALAGIMLELAEADLSFDVRAAGFSVGEIDLMVAAAEGDEGDTDDVIPEPGPVITQLGDIWDLGDHAVLAGSALDEASYASLMGNDQADLLFSDPPYNVPIDGHVSGLGKVKHREFAQASGEMSEEEFICFLMTALRLAARFSRDGSLHYWAMDWRHQYELSVAARAVYDKQVNLCVWGKTAAGMGSLYRSQHELFAVWRKGKERHRNNVELGRFGRSRSNLWRYPGANSFGRSSDEGNLSELHPTVKPVALIADAILDSTCRNDPTRPVTRVDLRLKYQDNPGGTDAELLTLRADKPFVLGGGWKLSTRADLPFVRNNAASPDNLDGDHEFGLGDILVQALFISPPQGKAAFAIGTQLIMPTGTQHQFTTGKWQLSPTVAAVYQLPEISRGSFVAILVKDAFSFAGDHDRADINVASIQPIFNWALPNKWFATFGPEAKFNARDNWKLFLPFDMTIGKKINPTTVASAQADIALIDEFKQYDCNVSFGWKADTGLETEQR